MLWVVMVVEAAVNETNKRGYLEATHILIPTPDATRPQQYTHQGIVCFMALFGGVAVAFR